MDGSNGDEFLSSGGEQTLLDLIMINLAIEYLVDPFLNYDSN